MYAVCVQCGNMEEEKYKLEADCVNLLTASKDHLPSGGISYRKVSAVSKPGRSAREQSFGAKFGILQFSLDTCVGYFCKHGAPGTWKQGHGEK